MSSFRPFPWEGKLGEPACLSYQCQSLKRMCKNNSAQSFLVTRNQMIGKHKMSCAHDFETTTEVQQLETSRGLI